ncbi:hypothetical protein F4802DRAFT_598548 [Xylaria palmicola]|nr:hypothetical protein F4802DRAFT_598548 [Xylaria palmicola]
MQSSSSSSSTAEQQASSSSTPYAPLPASPTLTNPDMILPDYDDSAVSLDIPQPPLTIWKDAHTSNMGFNLTPDAFTAGMISPMTPIIYGNGTMLSDIGEVTEVESTCGPSRSRSGSTRSEVPMMTSTALPYEAMKQKIKLARMAHQRQISVESNSTVTAHDQGGLFADFDDTVSIDDSNFQGDDEDSVADSYTDDVSPRETILPPKESSITLEEARYSTPLSRRAEQILANAKRRLTTMEGNLNRARSSLYSPSLSSMDSHSTPSPTVGRPATAVSVGNDHDHRKRQYGHNRISSDGNIPDDVRAAVSTQRSLSALGTAGGYRRPQQGSRNADYTHNPIKGAPLKNPLHGISPALINKVTLHGQDQPLEPLDEDGVLEEVDTIRQDKENLQADSHLSPTGPFPDKDMKRSASSSQMRDLKDQVNDLKGRLSTLRDQARADSLKRRSLQSLRTPSPFTHARVEQWYADTSSQDDSVTPHDSVNAQTTSESNISLHDRTANLIEEPMAPQGHDESQAVRPIHDEDATSSAPPNPAEPPMVSYAITTKAETEETEIDISSMNTLDDDADDMRTEDGYEPPGVNDFDESASESGASFYHDSVQVQVSHEDREDAFDYEHFFLHSAMGSMSRRRMRRKSSNDSFSSEDSVETTRGPTASQPTGVAAIKTGRRSRRGSAGSTSTMESFATATEGRHTRADILSPVEYSEEYEKYDDAYDDEYPSQLITLPERARTHTPDTAKRMVFGLDSGDSGSGPKRSQSSLHRRPQSSAAAFQHRPSVSSLSTGTNRSFPLITKAKVDSVVLASNGSPDQGLKRISETLMNEAASIYDKESQHSDEKVAPIQMLQRDDQILVERVVASLGRCVLGLTEAGRASVEGRAYRRKIEAAYRALEGSG